MPGLIGGAVAVAAALVVPEMTARGWLLAVEVGLFSASRIAELFSVDRIDDGDDAAVVAATAPSTGASSVLRPPKSHCFALFHGRWAFSSSRLCFMMRPISSFLSSSSCSDVAVPAAYAERAFWSFSSSLSSQRAFWRRL